MGGSAGEGTRIPACPRPGLTSAHPLTLPRVDLRDALPAPGPPAAGLQFLRARAPRLLPGQLRGHHLRVREPAPNPTPRGHHPVRVSPDPTRPCGDTTSLGVSPDPAPPRGDTTSKPVSPTPHRRLLQGSARRGSTGPARRAAGSTPGQGLEGPGGSRGLGWGPGTVALSLFGNTHFYLLRSPLGSRCWWFGSLAGPSLRRRGLGRRDPEGAGPLGAGPGRRGLAGRGLEGRGLSGRGGAGSPRERRGTGGV